MHHNKIVGGFGEKIAQKFLIKNKYEIIGCNAKVGYKEIDIIAKKDGMIIFIEVKTRTSDKFGKAEEALGARKINFLTYAIQGYLFKHNLNKYEIGFDLIAVDICKDKKTAKIKHYKNII